MTASLSPDRIEIRKLMALALPVAATQVSGMMLGFVDTVMVGRLSVEALAASSLANVWIHGVLMFGQGVVMGMDPFVTQAHGAADPGAVARASQRGAVIALGVSIPAAALLLATEEVLLLAGQDPELARAAEAYAAVQLPSVPCFLLYAALRLYLQGRGVVRPAMWVIAIANLFNVVFNWALIFGHLGFPALGLVGAGIATTLTRALSFFGLLLWVRVFALHRDAWVPWTRDSLRGLGPLLRTGFPVAIQISLEMWAFGGAALIAGWLGATPLAAHTIALNLAALAFMIPLGISQGAVTRVGNLIGAGRLDDAQRAARIALVLGAGVMTLSASAFIVLRSWLPRIYTEDPAVLALTAAILPIAAAFQIFDGTQVVGCGVLRGMGRTRPAAVFNALGYWVLGLPVGAFLAFRADFGLAGIWWGLCLGLFVVATLLVFWIQRYGPSHSDTPRFAPG